MGPPRYNHHIKFMLKKMLEVHAVCVDAVVKLLDINNVECDWKKNLCVSYSLKVAAFVQTMQAKPEESLVRLG